MVPLDSLLTWKQSLGYEVGIFTVSWIQSNYTGADIQEQIRNFLIDRYIDLGIEYVLLVGDNNDIPMRHCFPDPFDHNINSDYCPPTDYYYADLTGDWDSDGDGYPGEYGEDDVDFVPEVIVGRIPWSDPTIVREIGEKLVSFENDKSAWKDNALLLGAMSNYANESGSGLPGTDGAGLMETMIADMLSGWSYTTMYEKEGINSCLDPCDFPLNGINVVNNWSANDYGIVNWWAHGSYSAAWRKWWESDDGDGIPEGFEMGWEVFFHTSDISALDDDHPSLMFTCSCNNGWPELNSLGRMLLEHGSAGIVASTRISWYNEGWTDGNSGGNASLDYFYFHYLITERQKTGDALYSAK
ncbi:MAG: hypothetical protein JSV44_04330, partial [Candidatus Zixiibacteriota bacterium]